MNNSRKHLTMMVLSNGVLYSGAETAAALVKAQAEGVEIEYVTEEPTTFEISIPPWEYTEPFIPKQTHAERAKPNQPFYAKLDKRRRKK